MHLVECVDPEGQLQYTLLLKGLEHLWILLSTGSPEINPPPPHPAHTYIHTTQSVLFLSQFQGPAHSTVVTLTATVFFSTLFPFMQRGS